MGYGIAIVLLALLFGPLIVLVTLGTAESAFRAVTTGATMDIAAGLRGVLNVALFGAPAFYLLWRWWQHRKAWNGPLPAGFRQARRPGYLAGMLLIWIGHLGSAGFAAVLIVHSVGNQPDGISGIPLGLVFILYAVGLISVEVSFARWRRHNGDAPAISAAGS